jgi:hypothetical protein
MPVAWIVCAPRDLESADIITSLEAPSYFAAVLFFAVATVALVIEWRKRKSSLRFGAAGLIAILVYLVSAAIAWRAAPERFFVTVDDVTYPSRLGGAFYPALAWDWHWSHRYAINAERRANRVAGSD